VLVDDEHGPVAIYGLPYLDPDLLREPWALRTRSHEAVLGEAMRRVRADLEARPGIRSVAMAHAFVSTASSRLEASDSERDISVGGVSMVPSSVFDGMDYVALGHLHGQHTLTDSIRYSGSPLAFSFSEAGHRKGSWLVELGREGFVRAEFIDAPVPRALVRLSGTIDSLLTDTRLERHTDAWVQATLTDDLRPAQAMERLRKRFPHTLVLAFAPAGGTRAGLPTARLGAGRSDHDVTLDFMSELRGRPASEDESALLLDACDSCAPDRDLDKAVG
jgi:exonuclease SbcD